MQSSAFVFPCERDMTPREWFFYVCSVLSIVPEIKPIYRFSFSCNRRSLKSNHVVFSKKRINKN